jgi:hypothetical protein
MNVVRFALWAAITSSPAVVATAQQVSPEPEYEFARQTPRAGPSPVPIIYAEEVSRCVVPYDRLNLMPIDRYEDVIRYQMNIGRYARPVLSTIIQFAVAGDASRVQLIVVDAELGCDLARQLRRQILWIDYPAYRALQDEVLQAAAILTSEDRGEEVLFCDHVNSNQLDVRIRSEPNIALSRRGGCGMVSGTHRAGALVVAQAEQALGRSLPLSREMRSLPGSRADSRPDR